MKIAINQRYLLQDTHKEASQYSYVDVNVAGWIRLLCDGWFSLIVDVVIYTRLPVSRQKIYTVRYRLHKPYNFSFCGNVWETYSLRHNGCGRQAFVVWETYSLAVSCFVFLEK